MGALADGASIVSSNNMSQPLTWTERVAKLWGVNSVLGRGIGIHLKGMGNPRVAQCTIGRTDQQQYPFLHGPPGVAQAGCHFEPIGSSSVAGVVNFTGIPGQPSTTSGLSVSWGVYEGLQVGMNGA